MPCDLLMQKPQSTPHKTGVCTVFYAEDLQRTLHNPAIFL
jgi:hypothetical protein